MSLGNKIQTVTDLMEIPLDRFIILAINDCGYEIKTNDFIVNWVHSLFMKAHVEASKEDNPNYNQSTNGPFAN